jgi:hypothetical protein
MAEPQPAWTRWSEVFQVMAHPPYLRKTAGTAVVVGAVLFGINHLDEVVQGKASAATWIKGAATCLVPFCVANWGVLVATRRRPPGKS